MQNLELFYGTGNVSKFRNMEELIAGMPITLVGPKQLGIRLPEVEEDGDCPMENARRKAVAYYHAVGRPSMALDSGLYLEGVAPRLQPGTYVRRVGGRSLTDEEFIDYYCGLARQHGGRLKGRFVNGICVVRDEAHLKCAQGNFISTDWFWIVDQPCALRVEGFPMDSLAVYPDTGKYWVEGDQEDEQNAKGSRLARGIRQFFQEYLDGDDSWRREELY